jgi:hypothetical protein
MYAEVAAATELGENPKIGTSEAKSAKAARFCGTYVMGKAMTYKDSRVLARTIATAAVKA